VVTGPRYSQSITTLKNDTLSEKIVNDLICFCFGYAVDDIQKDYQDNGKSTIMEKIQTEKKFGNCQCGKKIQRANDV
jgi:hypothetical protein